MKKLLVILAITVLSLSGCATHAPTESRTYDFKIGGGVAGAAASSTVAIVLGATPVGAAVLVGTGTLLGIMVGDYFDEPLFEPVDADKWVAAVQNSSKGASTHWKNPDTDVTYEVRVIDVSHDPHDPAYKTVETRIYKNWHWYTFSGNYVCGFTSCKKLS